MICDNISIIFEALLNETRQNGKGSKTEIDSLKLKGK